MRISDVIAKQSKMLLENKQQAVLYAVILSILPFASWLSVALMALITLRKGAQAGFELVLPAMVIHSVPLMILAPVDVALISTVVSYIPCYLAAIILRKTISWQAVFGMFFVQSLLVIGLIHYLAPEFILDQLTQLKKLLAQYQEMLDSNSIPINSFLFAQFCFGLQMLGVIMSAVISLMFARFIQAKLFMADGFRNEMIEFRGGRVAFLILLGITLASYAEIDIAINLLPLILCYFFISGFGLLRYLLISKKQRKLAILFFLLLLLKPYLVLSVYMMISIVDSLFNFRLYLPEKGRGLL